MWSPGFAGFKLRAMRKLALYYLATWQLRLAIDQFAEACEPALTYVTPLRPIERVVAVLRERDAARRPARCRSHERTS
jgi:hypothetical protein